DDHEAAVRAFGDKVKREVRLPTLHGDAKSIHASEVAEVRDGRVHPMLHASETRRKARVAPKVRDERLAFCRGVHPIDGWLTVVDQRDRPCRAGRFPGHTLVSVGLGVGSGRTAYRREQCQDEAEANAKALLQRHHPLSALRAPTAASHLMWGSVVDVDLQ